MNIVLIIATIKYSQICRLVTWTFSKVKAVCRLVKFLLSRLLQDSAGSRLHFLHSFSSGCYHHTTTISWPFFWDHPVKPVPEENFWTLWCTGRLTEADTVTIRLGKTPSGLTSAHLHHPPIFFMGRMPFLPPNQQCQSSEGN